MDGLQQGWKAYGLFSNVKKSLEWAKILKLYLIYILLVLLLK